MAFVVSLFPILPLILFLTSKREKCFRFNFFLSCIAFSIDSGFIKLLIFEHNLIFEGLTNLAANGMSQSAVDLFGCPAKHKQKHFLPSYKDLCSRICSFSPNGQWNRDSALNPR